MSRIRLQDESSPEDFPFLDHPDEPIPEISPALSPAPASRAKLRPHRSWQASDPRTVIILLSLVKFGIVLSGMLILMPMYRLLEDAFCHAHFGDDSPGLMEEMKCKVEEVQSGLAFLMGWMGVLNSLCHLIATYPYGLLADRIGRKPVILLSYGGMASSFCLAPLMLGPFKYTMRENPDVMLGGAVLTLVGGGVPVLMSTLYAMAADVSTEENKGSNFLYLNLGAAGGSLLGPLIAGLLMSRFDPWVPIAIVLCTIPIIVGMLLFVPETLTVNVKAEPSDTLTMKEHLIRGGNDLIKSLRILKNINILLCMVTFFFSQARFAAATSTLTQYISKNFGWTLAETSILLSPLGIISIVVLGSLPKISEMMVSRYGYTSFGKDLHLAKLSLLSLTISSIIRGMASSIAPFLVGQIISSFGAAEQALVRATMSAFVSPSYTSRLFALVETVSVLGAPFGGPFLAWCFDRGMKWEGGWTGLPWYYLGLTCALAWGALVFVRAPRKQWDGEEVMGDDEDDLRPINPVRLD